jgi:CheY-like chemotaxis protein
MKLPAFLQPDPDGAETAAVIKPPPLDTLSILVVDDEPAFRSLLVDTLSQDGYHVIEAGDGAEAVVALEKAKHVDLVVTDVRMPQMDGISMANELRKTQPWVPIVFITGYPKDVRSNVPNSYVLSKPFLREDLMRAVHRFMA